MPLVDTHTHLESFARASALETALTRAREAGVEAMITIGTAPDDWSLYRDLARGRAGFVRYTVGLHPCSVDAGWERAVAQIRPFWEVAAGASIGDAGDRTAAAEVASAGVSPPRPGQPVAIGECGLDRFHLPKDEVRAAELFAWQCAAFDAQLALAKRLGCIVVVHSRGAFRESVERIDASGVDWSRVVFHCFTEGEAEVRELMHRGGVASFTGILTYKTAENVRQAARVQGLDRFMLETDAPYLAPVPQRGKPNEPAYVRHTAEFAARDVFAVPYEELAATSTANAKRFFRL